MFKSGQRRSGFTLPEVLVTVAIVAVLAAVVVPTVTNQMSKGDDTNLPANVSSLRSAVTAFVTDTRKYPSRIQHLQVAISDTDVDLFGNAYGTAAEAGWKGPYLSGGLKAFNAAARTDSVDWALAFAVDSLDDNGTGSGNFGTTTGLFIILGGVPTRAAALHIDSLIDAGNDSLTGSIRWKPAAGGEPDNARLFLLLMGAR
jgi:prepilin-type N-terminal cleavage/methylation domain-containing protein